MDQNGRENIIWALQVGVDPRQPGWQAIALERLEAGFNESGNPLTPWSALQFARRNSIPVPEWVLDHLENCAGRLDRIAVNGGDGKREAEAVGRALGFGADGAGGNARAAKSGQVTRDAMLALLVAYEMKLGSGRTKAAEIVANEKNVHLSMVKRAYKKHGERQTTVLNDLLTVLGEHQ